MNLKRLVDALDYDLLAAALGVSEFALRNLVSDRVQPQDEQSVIHIVHKLSEAGLPSTWLHQHNATLLPGHIDRLKQMASSSDSKTAIRRSNFRKIVDAFPDRNELLADALELGVSSITDILAGRLVFDDQRFGHINPRLVAAGFPDGWLELSSTELTAEMIQGLETQATDAIERELAEEEEIRSQVYINPEPTVPPAVTIAAQPAQVIAAGASVTDVEPTQRVELQDDNAAATAAATAQQQALWSAAELPPGQHQSPNTTGVPTTIKEPVMAKAKSSPPPAPMPRPSGKTASSAPSRAPTAGAVPLYAAVRPAGHQRSGAPAAKRAAVKQTAPAAKKAADKKTPTFASTQPAKKGAKKVEAQAHVFNRETDALTPEQSQVRADAIDRLFADSRRGAKSALWRDLLGSSLQVAGNIRRGTIMFRDEFANGAEYHLQLPKGWLDNPTKTLPPLPQWVTDPNVELPSPLPEHVQAAQAKAAKKAEKAGAVATPAPALPAKHAPTQGTLIGMPPPVPPRKGGVALTTEEAHAAQVAAGLAETAHHAAAALAPHAATDAQEFAPAAAPSVAPAPAATAPAHREPQHRRSHAATTGFVFTSPANPVPQEPSFLVQAVGGVVLDLARAGKFTDDDALRLINYLKGTH